MHTDEASGLNNLIVRPVYLRAVNAIVQPEIQVPCSLYFSQKWLPRLGALRWCLVLTLRMLCNQRQPDGTGRGEICRADLATALGIHEATISRILNTTPSSIHHGWRVLQPANQEDTETAWLAKFIPRLRYKYERDPAAGVTRRVGYVIDVVMDDPLVPEDEERLAVLIAEEVLHTLPSSPSMKVDTAAPHGASTQPTPDTELASATAQSARRAQRAVTHNVKAQHALSLTSVKQQTTSHTSTMSQQSASSRATVNKQNLSHMLPLARNEPTLTLTYNYTYRDIVIDLNLTRKRDIRVALTPLVELATQCLNDDHSQGMFFSTLTQLYPGHLEIFERALEAAEAEGQLSRDVNMGAVFVNAIKQLAVDAGVELRLGRSKPASVDTRQEMDADRAVEGRIAEELPCNETANVPGTGVAAKQLWSAVLQELRGRTSKANYEMWLRNCEILGVNGDVVVVGAPSAFARDWITERLLPIIERAVRDVARRELRVRCEVKQLKGGSR